jgi:hypothetical protein
MEDWYMRMPHAARTMLHFLHLLTVTRKLTAFTVKLLPLNNSTYRSHQKYCQIYQCSLYKPTSNTKQHPIIRHAHNFFKQKCMEKVCMALECIKYTDISLICDNSVTTQNVRFFKRDLLKVWRAIIFYECNDDTTALQRRVLQTALRHYTCWKCICKRFFLYQ